MALRTNSRRNTRRRSNAGLIGVGMLSMAVLGSAFLLRESKPTQTKIVTNPVVAEFDSVSLPVPAHFVPAGTKVAAIKFKQVGFPKHQIPEGALLALTSIAEAVTVAPLPANLPIFRENFSLTAGSSNPVVERIPPGMRAMTIRVDATAAVEGWAGSGSIVDVLLVEKDRTQVVAEKVRILSAERSVSPVEGSASPNVPSTVTLLVSQEQCLAINTAIPRGRIAFALRSTKDDENWNGTTFTADRLRGGTLVKDSRGAITGYAAVEEKDAQKSFALSDGKWIKTDMVPQGFFVGRDKNT